jgi:hypothetical protein
MYKTCRYCHKTSMEHKKLSIRWRRITSRHCYSIFFIVPFVPSSTLCVLRRSNHMFIPNNLGALSTNSCTKSVSYLTIFLIRRVCRLNQPVPWKEASPTCGQVRDGEGPHVGRDLWADPWRDGCPGAESWHHGDVARISRSKSSSGLFQVDLRSS